MFQFPCIDLARKLFLKIKKIHFGFMGVILLHSGQRHVSANHVAIFRKVRTRIQIKGVPGGMCQTSGGCSLC
jgi:hypothetical protein